MPRPPASPAAKARSGWRIRPGIAHAGRTVTVEAADATFRVYDGDQRLTEVARTTTKLIARFTARKPQHSRLRTRRHNDRMPADEAQLWQLLCSLNDRNHLEFPANYNHQRARARFNQLAERINRGFGCQCDVDREVQDASFHGRIDISAAVDDLGYTLIPEGPLWKRYDGPGDTWWTRYFDYL
ncbi:hypothetical protein [Micromonospora sp. NPDC005367]|uniref:hypothetical protein n=1 Tax=Micromonospora sp. NPDC005367 TaxID=3155590 RepID=UPI0033B9E9BC